MTTEKDHPLINADQVNTDQANAEQDTPSERIEIIELEAMDAPRPEPPATEPGKTDTDEAGWRDLLEVVPDALSDAPSDVPEGEPGQAEPLVRQPADVMDLDDDQFLLETDAQAVSQQPPGPPPPLPDQAGAASLPEVETLLPTPSPPRRSTPRQDAKTSTQAGSGPASAAKKAPADPADTGQDDASQEGSEPDEGATLWKPTAIRREFPFVVNWQGQSHLVRLGKVHPGLKPGDAKAFCLAFCDFFEEEGPGLLRVSGDVKYAAVMARKRAEEMGLLGTEGTFHAYRIFKKGKEESETLYHILPQARLRQIMADCRTPEGCVLFDGVALLAGLLKKSGQATPRALILHGETSLLALAGTAQNIALARRYPLFSSDAQELRNMLVAIDMDLRTVQEDHGISFSEMELIEAWHAGPLPDLSVASLPDARLPVTPWPVASLEHLDQTIWTALPFALEQADRGLALAGAEERFVRPLQVWEKWLHAGLILGTIFLGGLIWLNMNVEQSLGWRQAALEDEVLDLEMEIAGIGQEQILGRERLDQVVGLVQDLRRSGHAPAPGWIWNAFFAARPAGWEIHSLDLTYGDDRVDIHAQGMVAQSPPRAEQGLRVFRQGLLAQGFAVHDSTLRLGANQADFDLALSYPWHEAQTRSQE